MNSAQVYQLFKDIAEPVSLVALENLLKFLGGKWTDDVSAPRVAVEPTVCITLRWVNGGNKLAISFGVDGQIYYAAILPSDASSDVMVCWSERFDNEVPEYLSRLIRDNFPA